MLRDQLIQRTQLTISNVVMNSTSSIEMNGMRHPTAPEIVVYTNTSFPPDTIDTFVNLLVSTARALILTT